MVSMLRSVCILAIAVMIVSCAKGATAGLPSAGSDPDRSTDEMAGAGSMPAGGAGGSVTPDASAPVFDGDTCIQGESMPCSCEASAEEGTRICLANRASPTGGEYSECRGCPEVTDAGMEPAGGASGMMAPAGGMGGAGGMDATGGTGGAGGAGGMSATGGMNATGGMSGGQSGAGGVGGTSPTCSCMDLLQCCRDDGTCGVGVPGLCL